MHLQTRYAQSMTENKKKKYFFSFKSEPEHDKRGRTRVNARLRSVSFLLLFFYLFSNVFMFYSSLFLSAFVYTYVIEFLSLSNIKSLYSISYFKWFFGWTYCLLHIFVCLFDFHHSNISNDCNCGDSGSSSSANTNNNNIRYL